MSALTHLAELERTFVTPRFLSRSRPRDVQLTATGRLLVALAMLLLAGAIAAGVGLYLAATRAADARRALVENGATASGEVTRLWQDDENRRRVGYRFVVDGRTYEGRANVSTEQRRQLALGSTLAVRYVPGNPATNDLGGRPRGGVPLALPFVVSPLIAAFGVWCLLAIRGQHRLLSDGRVAPAVVTGHHKHDTGDGGSQRAISFEFPLLSGSVASGKAGTSSRPPAIGSVICVIYDPDWPARNKVYPLSLVRPAA